MRKKILIEFVVLLFTFLTLWGIFTYFPLFDKGTTVELSVGQERQLGQLLVTHYLNQQQLIRSPPLDSTLSSIHQRLTNNIGSTDYNYDIYVVRRKSINAFALPGEKLSYFRD